MEPETVVGAREDAHADFGREEESPRVVVLLDDVVIGRKFGVVGTQLQARIRLEYAVRKPGVTAGDAERQLEYGVLLLIPKYDCNGFRLFPISPVEAPFIPFPRVYRIHPTIRAMAIQ